MLFNRNVDNLEHSPNLLFSLFTPSSMENRSKVKEGNEDLVYAHPRSKASGVHRKGFTGLRIIYEQTTQRK